ncbi:MAG: caspase family protein [Cyclobacteriaceae bacterium]
MRHLVVAILLLILTSAQAQISFPELINTEALQTTPVMLPDSSIMFSDFDVGSRTFKIKRMEWSEGEWVESPNQLTELLLSMLSPDVGDLHFRFSLDNEILLVLVHKPGSAETYISKYNDGVWSFPHLLHDGADHHWTEVAPSLSSDNQYMYLPKPAVKEKNTFSRLSGELFAEREIITIQEMYEISEVIGLGPTSVIIRGTKEKKGEEAFYMVKQDDNGNWSYPIYLRDFPLFQSYSFTPFDQVMMCQALAQTDQGEGWDIGVIETPKIIQDELKAIRSLRATASIPLSKEVVESKSQDEDQELEEGQYYALLIGNADYYDDELDLDKPVEDVSKMRQILTDHYIFKPENVITLENADRNEIFRVFFDLRKKLRSQDNLLIFYAGHGVWDKEVEQGYWWPVDADAQNPANWLSNSDLREQIRGINTAHTLLISDACFSGGIFKTRGSGEIRNASIDIQLLYRMPSRRAITSGTMSTVPDNSVFFRYLTKYLEENDKKFIASGDLFTMIRRSVLNNSLTVPQEGVIMDTGDEGGDFIFIKKD